MKTQQDKKKEKENKMRLIKYLLWLAALAVGATGLRAATVVTTGEALKSALEAGGEVQLGADVSVSAQVTMMNDSVLDLNGHKITGSGVETLFYVKCQDFKLINSDENTASGISHSYKYAYLPGYTGKTFGIDVGSTAVFGEADGSKANFTVSGDVAALSVSGAIVINGGEFSSLYQDKAAEGGISLLSGSSATICGGSMNRIYGTANANLSIPVQDKVLACFDESGMMRFGVVPASGLDLALGQIIIPAGGGQSTYRVYQSGNAAATSNTLTVCAASGNMLTVVVDGLNVNHKGINDVIVCKTDAGSTVALELDHATTIGSVFNTASILKVGDGTLVIQDDNEVAGSLSVKSGYSAAIGSEQNKSVKNIVIKGGTITAEGNYGAAIGAGQGSTATAENIQILGGTVVAKGNCGSCIGAGQYGTASNIRVVGGDVTATGARGQPVGNGMDASPATATDVVVNCGSYSKQIETSYLPGGAAQQAKVDAMYVVTPVALAKIGDTEYTSLEAALADVGPNAPLTWVHDGVWPVESPVVYGGAFWTTLGAAMKQANLDNAGSVAKIYVRPGYSAGSGFAGAHELIKTDMTIFGNNASINTKWQPDFEYPDFGGPEFNTMSQDIHFAICNLHDGAGIWGCRTTAFDAYMSLLNCTNAYEIFANRMGGTGKNHFTATRCTFVCENLAGGMATEWPLTSDNAGSVTVVDCYFEGLKNAAKGKLSSGLEAGQQFDLTVTGSTFKNCKGGEEYAKGVVRASADVDGTVNLVVDGCVFEGTQSGVCDVTLGDGKASASAATMNYSIRNTACSFVVTTKDAAKLKVDTTLEASEIPFVGDNIPPPPEVHVEVVEPVVSVEGAENLTEVQKTSAEAEVANLTTNVVVALIDDPVIADADTGIKGTVTEESKSEIVQALEASAAEGNLTVFEKSQIEQNIEDFLDPEKESSSSSNYLNVAVQAVEATVKAETETTVAAKATAVVYEVKPIIETVVSNTVGETRVVTAVIPNRTVEEMAANGNPMSFNLPITDPNATCAKVTHTSGEPTTYPTETFTCPVWTDATTHKRYITITVSHFSLFGVEPSSAVLADSKETIGLTKLGAPVGGEVSFGVPFLKSGVETATTNTLAGLVVAGAQAGDTAKSWTAGNTDTNTYAAVAAADAAIPGQAVWYTRAAASAVPLTLAGYVVTNGLGTTGAVSATTDRPGMTLFANPHRTEVNVLVKLTSTPTDGDQVVVEGDSTRYFYEGGWKRTVPGAKLKSKEGVTIRGAETAAPVLAITVPAGKTFWYVTTTGVPSVEW